MFLQNSPHIFFTLWSRYGVPLLLLLVLLLFEISIHPLGFGPDRRIHDPGVYRQSDHSYMAGDWYTDMAEESHIYVFYSKFITLGPSIGVPEETWRISGFVICLIVLYGAMLGIARLFSKNILVVPGIAFLHALLIISAPPLWLYGPFIQIDGGLAPRSVGVALSFLSLFFLLQRRKNWPWILLGIATLIHVSNSLIIFSLFFSAWLFQQIWGALIKKDGVDLVDLIKTSANNILLYLLAGGWFALAIAVLGVGQESVFSDEKFIWTWIYFRAPYMALPLVPWQAWCLFLLHIVALISGWIYLRYRNVGKSRERLDLLGLIGIGAVLYFFAFYFFTFIWPWLIAFQFYSIRVIYIAYFISYLFLALSLVQIYRIIEEKTQAYHCGKIILRGGIAIVVGVMIWYMSTNTRPGEEFLKRAPNNFIASWAYLKKPGFPAPSGSVALYLAEKKEPFLAPIYWNGASEYLPHAASFKTFGFTKKGLEEWFERMNDMSRGELEKAYKEQSVREIFRPVTIDWETHYRSFTAEEVLWLGDKYKFKLFLTYKNRAYPFQSVAEDENYRLYQLPL